MKYKQFHKKLFYYESLNNICYIFLLLQILYLLSWIFCKKKLIYRRVMYWLSIKLYSINTGRCFSFLTSCISSHISFIYFLCLGCLKQNKKIFISKKLIINFKQELKIILLYYKVIYIIKSIQEIYFFTHIWYFFFYIEKHLFSL